MPFNACINYKNKDSYFMTNSNNDFSEMQFSIEFLPKTQADIELVKHVFSDEDVFESSAFTGQESVTVIISTARKVLEKLTSFLVAHRQGYKDAKVKIGTDEISLQGYSMREVESFLKHETIQKLLEKTNKQ